MKLGIVGHEGLKFTPKAQEAAREHIRRLIGLYQPQTVVSGACHLGGIDIWAIEEARKLRINTVEYAPVNLSWDAPGGFKDRNLRIAENSDVLACLVVDRLPERWDGMVFANCYHCHTRDHVKSGGCWTMNQAKRLGRQTVQIIIPNTP